MCHLYLTIMLNFYGSFFTLIDSNGKMYLTHSRKTAPCLPQMRPLTITFSCSVLELATSSFTPNLNFLHHFVHEIAAGLQNSGPELDHPRLASLGITLWGFKKCTTEFWGYNFLFAFYSYDVTV